MNGPLEHVEGRLAALLQKLNSISEKKAALEDSEKNNKVCAHLMFSRILNLLFCKFRLFDTDEKSLIVSFLECQSLIEFNWFEQTYLAEYSNANMFAQIN